MKSSAMGTDLESRLASQQGEALREAYKKQLLAIAIDVHIQISNGVTPTDYPVARALANAVDAALDILDQHATQKADNKHPPSPISIQSAESSALIQR